MTLEKLIVLVNQSISVDEGTRQALSLVHVIAVEGCERLMTVMNTRSLSSVFTTSTPMLRALTVAVSSVPRAAAVIVKSFLTEDLHRFLMDHQLSTIMAEFPATFCNNPNLGNYFDLIGLEGFISTLCHINVTEINQELAQEQAGLMDIFMRQQNMNNLQILGEMVDKMECIYNTTMHIDWMAVVDVSPFMPVLNMTYGMDANQW